MLEEHRTNDLVGAPAMQAVARAGIALSIRMIAELPSPKYGATTMIGTHVLNRGDLAVRSPVDGL